MNYSLNGVARMNATVLVYQYLFISTCLSVLVYQCLGLTAKIR